MAASAECREEVTKNGGIRVLLQFLDASVAKSSVSAVTVAAPGSPEENGKRPEDFAQMAATERVLQKSAIALSR